MEAVGIVGNKEWVWAESWWDLIWDKKRDWSKKRGDDLDFHSSPCVLNFFFHSSKRVWRLIVYLGFILEDVETSRDWYVKGIFYPPLYFVIFVYTKCILFVILVNIVA